MPVAAGSPPHRHQRSTPRVAGRPRAGPAAAARCALTVPAPAVVCNSQKDVNPTARSCKLPDSSLHCVCLPRVVDRPTTEGRLMYRLLLRHFVMRGRLSNHTREKFANSRVQGNWSSEWPDVYLCCASSGLCSQLVPAPTGAGKRADEPLRAGCGAVRAVPAAGAAAAAPSARVERAGQAPACGSERREPGVCVSAQNYSS